MRRLSTPSIAVVSDPKLVAEIPKLVSKSMSDPLAVPFRFSTDPILQTFLSNYVELSQQIHD